jgi:outer membrane protein
MTAIARPFFYAVMLLFVTYLPSAIAAPEAMKMGYVNLEIALSQELEAQKYTKELEKEEQDILDAEQKAGADIEKKVADFQKTSAKLSEKAKLEQQTALGNEYNNLRQQFAQRRMDVNKKRQDILANVENKNRLLLESISRKEGYTLVFNSAVLVYVSEDIKKNDITAKLVAEYNKAYPVKVEGPKKPSVKDAIKKK